jgi:hypothetical protein
MLLLVSLLSEENQIANLTETSLVSAPEATSTPHHFETLNDRRI